MTDLIRRGLVVPLAVVLAAGCAAATPGGTGTPGSPGSPRSPGATGDSASCDGYPTEPIEFVIPNSPGGGYDTWARTLAPFIQEHLPNQVDILPINEPGAGGLIAAQGLATAEPDGTRIQIISLTGLAAAQVGSDVEFDITEFAWLARAGTDASVILVAADSPIATLDDLKAQAATGPVGFAHTGFTSSSGVNMAIIFDALEIPHTPVLHEGSSEAAQSILRGDTVATSSSISSALEDIRAGDLKPIVFIGKEKPAEGELGYEETVDLETLADHGFETLGEALETQRVIATAPGTPECIAGVLEDAIGAALADEDFLAAAEENELVPDALDAAATRETVQTTLEVFADYADVLRAAIEAES